MRGVIKNLCLLAFAITSLFASVGCDDVVVDIIVPGYGFDVYPDYDDDYYYDDGFFFDF